MSLTDFRTLGRSGLVVSPLALGTMTFGPGPFGADEPTSRSIFDAYRGAGGNFVDTVLAMLGRAFALDGSITGVELRRKVVGQWGERTSVSLGATKTAGTLRHLGIIGGGGNNKPYVPAPKLDVSSLGASWLIHCLLCSRGAASINTDDVATAPELFWTGPLVLDRTYPMLELHREGMNRRVWAIR